MSSWSGWPSELFCNRGCLTQLGISLLLLLQNSLGKPQSFTHPRSSSYLRVPSEISPTQASRAASSYRLILAGEEWDHSERVLIFLLYSMLFYQLALCLTDSAALPTRKSALCALHHTAGLLCAMSFLVIWLNAILLGNLHQFFKFELLSW